MRLYFFIIIFLLIGAFFIVSNSNINFKDQGDVSRFIRAYYIWVGSLFDKVVKFTGYVVNSEWLPSFNKKSFDNNNSFNSSD